MNDFYKIYDRFFLKKILIFDSTESDDTSQIRRMTTTPVLTPLHHRKRFLEPEVVIMSRIPGVSNREGFRDLGTRALDLDPCLGSVTTVSSRIILFRNRG
jgi:hypothetical protein